jgi:hypothetical protein
MLSSRFLALSFLYIFYAAGLAAADPRNPLGGDEQLCQSVRTVTITQTVAPGKPSSVSRSANSPPPVLTTRPGNVNLGNGATNLVKNTKTSSVVKNTKTSSAIKNTKTSSAIKNTKKSSVIKNTKTSSVVKNTKTSSVVKNTKTSSIKANTKTSTSIVNKTTGTVKNSNTKDVKGTKTTSILISSTGLSTTSLPLVTTTGRSLAAEPSSTATPPVDANTGDPNTSLTLDPSVIQNINGKGQATGEADSLVSTNDFIGFCVGKTITNGKQVKAGSCNPVPMGDMPSVDNMPSAKFSFPKNFDTIAADTPFTISITIRNLVTGTFTNAANTYYAAPQQLVNGVIQGHSHVTVQLMTSLDSPEPLNPKVFAFFKGLNGVSNNGVLTADVTKGLPAGVYRLSSINSAGNHQEALGPIAQRGSFNDVVYFTVTDGGAGSNSTSSSSSVPPASTDISSTSVVDPAATPSDVSSSNVLSSTVSLPDDSSTPLTSPTDKGGKGGKRPPASSNTLPVSTSTGVTDTIVSSATLPVSTSGSGKKGDKGGNVVSTSVALPQSATPPTSTSNNSIPTKGANGRGGKDNGGTNGQRSKRMHKRSHWA